MPTHLLPSGLYYTYQKPPCTCEICTTSFRDPAIQEPPSGYSYSLELPDEEARSLASEHLKCINLNLTYLREQWATNGKTIANRWKKKSRDKRAVLLKAADAELFEKQWFAPMFTSKELLGESTGNMGARKYRNVILLDYLTVDGLKSDPSRLLGLLQNRSLYGPDHWAIYDNQKLEWAWRCGLLDIDASKLCMVMYGPRYGELIDWNARTIHSGETIGFPRARLVLEAQEALLRFLRNVVAQMVEDVKPQDASDIQPLVQQIEFKRTGRIDLWSNYINRPFAPPPFFDIDDMYLKALARLNMTGDHLWLLQTDPAYLCRLIRLAAEGYPEGHPKEDVHKFAVAEIYYSIWTYWSWSWIVEACQNVKDMQTKFRDAIHPGQPLPPKYEHVLQELELILETQVQSRLNPLPMLLAERPGFRKYFKFDYSDPDQVAITGMIDLPELHHKDPIFYILQLLAIDPTSGDPGNFDIITKWSFLEDCLGNTNPEDAARLDEMLYDRYTEFAAVHELFTQTHFHLPMPGLLANLTSYSPQEIKQLERPTVFKDQIEKITEEIYMLPIDLDASKYLMRFSKEFNSHLTKADLNDQMRLEQFDNTRAALSNFWSLIRRKRQSVLKKQPKLWTPEDIREDLKILSADMDSSYKDIVHAKRQKIVDRIARLGRHPLGAAGPIQTEWESTSEISKVSKPSTKLKTRAGKQTTALDIDTLSLTPKTQDLVQIPVKVSTLRVLNTMFSSSVESASKLINWDDFVLAMNDVGFSARQTTGSEVVFQPEKNDRDWNGRINFHKPHPVGKIDRIMMRAIGKRMNRWYGWVDGMFVIRGK